MPKKGPSESPRGLAAGLLSLAELLEVTAEFTEKLATINARPEMKTFQRLVSDPEALSVALKGSSGEVAGKLFGVLNQIGGLQGPLSSVATLPAKERAALIKQLRAMSQTIGSVGRTL